VTRLPVKTTLQQRQAKESGTMESEETKTIDGDTFDDDTRAGRDEPAHKRDIMSFSAHLTHIMIDAVGHEDSLLNWRDTVFCATLAIKTVGSVARMIAKKKGKEITELEMMDIMLGLMEKGMKTSVVMAEVGSEEEADEMMAAMTDPRPKH
jgi:hypothetical protein